MKLFSSKGQYLAKNKKIVLLLTEKRSISSQVWRRSEKPTCPANRQASLPSRMLSCLAIVHSSWRTCVGRAGVCAGPLSRQVLQATMKRARTQATNDWTRAHFPAFSETRTHAWTSTRPAGSGPASSGPPRRRWPDRPSARHGAPRCRPARARRPSPCASRHRRHRRARYR